VIENVAYREVLNCTNVTNLKLLENVYLKSDANGIIKPISRGPYWRLRVNKMGSLKT
jgi:hypothetical protein